MGYRSTFTTLDTGTALPEWFLEKHKERTMNPRRSHMVSKGESKLFYDNEFLQDYQKALIETGYFSSDEQSYKRIMYVVVLGESGAVTRVDITADRINFFLMTPDLTMEEVWCHY